MTVAVERSALRAPPRAGASCTVFHRWKGDSVAVLGRRRETGLRVRRLPAAALARRRRLGRLGGGGRRGGRARGDDADRGASVTPSRSVTAFETRHNRSKRELTVGGASPKRHWRLVSTRRTRRTDRWVDGPRRRRGGGAAAPAYSEPQPHCPRRRRAPVSLAACPSTTTPLALLATRPPPCDAARVGMASPYDAACVAHDAPRRCRSCDAFLATTTRGGSRRARRAQFVGTPLWMAPEIARTHLQVST